MNEPVPWIDSATLKALVSASDLIPIMRRAFADPPLAPPRTRHDLSPTPDSAALLMMPAWRRGGGLGVKIATVCPANRQLGLPSVSSTYLLHDCDTGRLDAVIDGDSLTVMRTAAVSALACDLLAPRSVRHLLVAGTGALAPLLVEAHCSVRNFDRVTIWGRTPENAKTLAAALSRKGAKVDWTSDLESACRTADVVSTATLSLEPLIHGRWLKDGAHLDLVGAFRPTMYEADSAVVADAAIVVDTLAALEECGDLADPLRSGLITAADVVDLTHLLRGASLSRGRLTLFKTIGTAISDLAAAEEILRRARSGHGVR